MTRWFETARRPVTWMMVLGLATVVSSHDATAQSVASLTGGPTVYLETPSLAERVDRRELPPVSQRCHATRPW